VTPAEMAAKLNRIAAALPRELATGQAKVGKAGIRIAHYWSSPVVTPEQLAARGHPYRKAVGDYSTSPAVHRQTGTFFANWRYDPAGKRLVNATPYGQDLQQGTATMAARDILGAIRTQLRPILHAESRRAIERSLKA
jgi:hypothetical protein